MTARWKAHKGKAFLRLLTAQRVHTFLQKETAVSARFWTEDLSRVRRTWWPLHYRNLQPGLRLSFQSWILVNFTTYGAWPPVTYLTYLTSILIFTLKNVRPQKAYVGPVKKVTAVTWPLVTYLTGPTQAFRGQCINKSLFEFIIILLCKTYSSTLRKQPVNSSYTLQLININIYKEKGPSMESICRSRQISYSCHFIMLDFELDFGEFHHIWCMTTRNLFDGSYTGFPWTMH